MNGVSSRLPLPRRDVGRLTESAPVLPRLDAHSRLVQGLLVVALGAGLGVYAIAAAALPAELAPLFVLAALVPFAALIVGSLRKLLLAIILLDIPFHVDVHLGYRNDIGSLGGVGGLDISLTTICLAVLLLLLLAELLVRPESPSRPALAALLAALFYAGFSALSAVVARDLYLAAFGIFIIAEGFLLFTYIAYSVRTREDVVFVVTVLLVGLILASLLMLAQRVIGHDFDLGPIHTHIESLGGGRPDRMTGTFFSPNVAGAYLSLLLAPAASLLFAAIGPRYKALATLAFVLGVMALLLTFSRGGWVAFALSMAIIGLLVLQRGWWVRLLPAGLAGTAVLLFFGNTILTRLLGDDRGAAAGRLPLLQIAARIIRDHPLLGIGANNYALAMQDYLTPEFTGDWIYVVHNKYLITWAETGIGALLAFIGFLVVTLRNGWLCWRRNDAMLSPLALGLVAGLAGHMVHMNLDVFNARLPDQLVWVIAGLITAMLGVPPEAQPAGDEHA